MKIVNDIEALLKRIEDQYMVIKSIYDDSLYKKEIPIELKIEIKNYLENAKSVLDYLAHDVCEKLEIISQQIYFPIVARDKNIQSYRGFIARHLHQLEIKHNKLFNFFESIQPYNSGQEWLGDFATICNDSKHQHLTPQIRHESERIVSQHVNGGNVSWDPSAVRFGQGVFINGASVNPLTQLPVSTPLTTITREVWISFLFMDNIDAFSMLKKIKEEIPIIVNETYKLLGSETENKL